MMKTTVAQRKKAQAIINDLVEQKNQLCRVGMLKTMHSLDETLRVAGYELADHILEAKKPR